MTKSIDFREVNIDLSGPKMPSHEDLERCRNGLTRQIKQVKSHQDRQRLKDIRDEIDFLIDNL